MNAATFRVGWLARDAGDGDGPSVEVGLGWLTSVAILAAVSIVAQPQLVATDAMAVLFVLAGVCAALLTRRRNP